MTLITMTAREIDRFGVMKNLEAGKINGTEASTQLHITTRQVRRLKKRFNVNKPLSVVHRGRGKESNRKLKQVVQDKIVKLLLKFYIGFGPTLAAEKLWDRDKIKVSDETIRTIMVKNNLWKAKVRKKNKQHREWRPRRDNYGTMVQYDGSYHHWFGELFPEYCLLLAVDDATGKIVRAWFEYHEGIKPTFAFWQAYVLENGKPTSIYLDKFSTYKVNHKNAEDNKELITQFQRACRDLGIQLISAHSPEAKGRVERMFGTLQDRLVKEFRLQGITDIVSANQFLKEKYIDIFNAKFAVVPVKQANLHRQLTAMETKQLPSIFSKHSERIVMNDFTVRFDNKYLQLEEQQPLTVCRKDKILIEEHLNGSIKLKLRNKELKYRALPKRPEKEFNLKIPALTTGKPTYVPPANHPWRQYKFTNKKILQAVC